MRCLQLRINGTTGFHTPRKALRGTHARTGRTDKAVSPPGLSYQKASFFSRPGVEHLTHRCNKPIPEVGMRGKSDESSPIVDARQIEFKLSHVMLCRS